VRARGAELPPALSGALLLAAVRLSDQMAEAVRPERLTVDESGNLALGPNRGIPENEVYQAPELRNGAALPRDPRVLVYAAGALGYELVTLSPLADTSGSELKGPLAPIIRKAVAKDRKRRFRNLDEMALAIEEVQARPSDEEERLILAAVASTTSAPPPSSTPLGRIELEQAPAPDEPEERPAPAPPSLPSRGWDPFEQPPAVIEAPPPLADPAVVELHEGEVRDAHRATIPGVQEMPVVQVPLPTELPWDGDDLGVVHELRGMIEQEGKSRQADLAVLDARVETLVRTSARLASLEERLSAAPPPARHSPAWLTGALGVLIGAGAMLLLAPSRPSSPGPVALSVSSPAPPTAAPKSPPPLPLPGQGELAGREEPRPVEHPPRERPALPRQRPAKVASASASGSVSAGSAAAAREHVSKGDKALRSFNPTEAMAAFQEALRLDPHLAGAHRGMGMAYVLEGKNAEAKTEYRRYLQLAPDAPDREQIQRLLAR
jgi:tetratricopeptide repeat protein